MRKIHKISIHLNILRNRKVKKKSFWSRRKSYLFYYFIILDSLPPIKIDKLYLFER